MNGIVRRPPDSSRSAGNRSRNPISSSSGLPICAFEDDLERGDERHEDRLRTHARISARGNAAVVAESPILRREATAAQTRAHQHHWTVDLQRVAELRTEITANLARP